MKPSKHATCVVELLCAVVANEAASALGLEACAYEPVS